MAIEIVPTKLGMQDIDRSTFQQAQNIIDDNNMAKVLDIARSGSVSDNELRRLNPEMFADLDDMQARNIANKRNKLEEMGVNTRMMSDQEIIMMDMGMALASGELRTSGTGVTSDKDMEMIMQLRKMGFSDEDVIAALMQQEGKMQTDANMGALNNLTEALVMGKGETPNFNVPSPEARSESYDAENILMGRGGTPNLTEALNPDYIKGMEMFGKQGT